MDYKNTLNLPKTGFSMKANLIEKEPQIQKFWEENKIYEKILEKNKNNPKFVLHDGPPYSNGEIHMGHILNKTLKDILNRYKLLNGFYSYYKPGWDCHGLPIEQRTIEELKIKDITKIDKRLVRKKSEEIALKYFKIQREQFKRLGVIGAWDDPYLTLTKEYESKIIEVFKKLYEKGYIYRALKSIQWCKNCRTALADAEVEYMNLPSPSIYVFFPFTNDSIQKLEEITSKKLDRCGVLIWTTTPWTLPGNLAVTLNPDFEYALVKTTIKEERWNMLIVKELVENVFNKIGLKVEEVVEVNPQKLEYLEYTRPVEENPNGKIILDTFVSKEEGTGCVHTAPGHGEEDYYAGLRYKIQPYSPVDEDGKFRNTVEWLNGKDVFTSQKEIIEYLKNKGILLFAEEIEHSYPICWRCKNPLIFRATQQWFLDIDKHNLRQRLLEEVEKVEWIPEWGKTRISNMIKNRPHWCLSRQRSWGVPLPVFYCKNCSHELINTEIIERIQGIFYQSGSNIWFEENNEDYLLGKKYQCAKCKGTEFVKGMDIFDVWFESGVSWFVVLVSDEKLSYPCDYYLEGSDQHRGWFQVSLIPSVAIFGKAPYKTVLTHSFTVTEKGEKISKSDETGKIFSFGNILNNYGADVIRLYIASADTTDDFVLSKKHLDHIAQSYVKIRNTFRFILANLYDFNPLHHEVHYENLTFVDKVFYNKMVETVKQVNKYMSQFALHKLYSCVSNFIIVDLSSLYFDIVKEKLYTYYPDDISRRSTQTVFWYLAQNFVVILAPIIPHTAEEIYSFLPQKKYDSVHLANWPDYKNATVDVALLDNWNKILIIRNEANKILEELRNKKVIGRSREAHLKIEVKDFALFNLLSNLSIEKDILEDIFLVSKIEVIHNNTLENDFLVYATRYEAPKCERCWLHQETVGKNKDYPDICDKCVQILQKLKI